MQLRLRGLMGCSILSMLCLDVSLVTAQTLDSNPSAPDFATQLHMDEVRRLREILKTAQPMPEPPRLYGTSAGTVNSVMSFDPATGKVVTQPASQGMAAGGPNYTPGKPPEMPGGIDLPAPGPPIDVQAGGMGPAAAPPDSLLNPLSYPWQTVNKMLMRFVAYGVNYYYTCSSFQASSFHALTAAHCMYNHSIGGTGVKGWASEVWVYPAHTDQVSPLGEVDWPYGVAKMRKATTYTAWITSQDLNYDWAWITLDRRIGDRTGWMGREWGYIATLLNFSGYPTQTPYVPSGTPYQWPGLADNLSYTTYRIASKAYIYGGHSGGPMWRYDGTNRYVEGTNSTSNRVGDAEDTRFRDVTNNDLVATINSDNTYLPPIARCNLIEYLFNTTSKDLGATVVPRGTTVSVKWNILNMGFASCTTPIVYFYLSTDKTITSADRLIATATLSTLNANTVQIFNSTLTIPSNTPAGNYYLGWLLYSPSTGYGTDDNTAVIDKVLSVTAPLPGAFSLISPTSGSTGVTTTPTLSWNASSNATSYDLYLGTSASPALYRSNIAGLSTSVTTPLALNTLYYWRVVAKNVNGSTTSATWSFRTAGVLPGAFTLISPSSGAAGVVLNPVLSWTTSANALAYDVYLGTSFTPALYRSNLTTTSTAVSPNLLLNTYYYWRVVAKNAAGAYSTSVRSFRTIALPGAFSLLAPSDGAAKVLQPAKLSWNVSTNATAYDIYAGYDPYPTVMIGSTSSTSALVSGALPNSTVFWRIVARNSVGSISSAVRRYSVAAAHPAVPTNNGFETGALAPWVVYGNTPAPFITTSEHHSGSRALAEVASGGVYQEVSGLTPGLTYLISAWVKSSTGTTRKAALYVNDGTGVNGVGVGWYTPPALWTSWYVLFKATGTGKARIHLDASDGAGYLVWDDVGIQWYSLTPADQPPINTEGPTMWTPAVSDTGPATDGPVKVGARSFTSVSFADLTAGNTYLVKAKFLSTEGGKAALYVQDTTGAGGAGMMSEAESGELAVRFTATRTMKAVALLSNAGSTGTVAWSEVEIMAAPAVTPPGK